MKRFGEICLLRIKGFWTKKCRFFKGQIPIGVGIKTVELLSPCCPQEFVAIDIAYDL